MQRRTVEKGGKLKSRLENCSNKISQDKKGNLKGQFTSRQKCIQSLHTPVKMAGFRRRRRNLLI